MDTQTTNPPRTVGLARVREIQAHASLARWADGVAARNRARERYNTDPRNFGGDWPEDH